MENEFSCISLRVPRKRFANWEEFIREVPEYSIGVEVIDDVPGHRGHYVHFDHHKGVIREAVASAAMQAYIAVRQGRIMERWLEKRRPVPVYVWNADQDVCLTAFVLEYHYMLERAAGMPLLRWIVQYNNKIDVCGGLYPVNLDDLVKNHFTWVFEPYREQRMRGRTFDDEGLVKSTIRKVCDRLLALLQGRAGICPITVQPEILYESPYDFVIVDEKGDPNSRLVLAAQGHRNLISLIAKRPDGRYVYSVIRGSPYDEDRFQVERLIEAFQAAEDQPEASIWGGSSLAAGSDSTLASSLHWTQLRDIAEPIVRQACEAGATDVAGEPDEAPEAVVLVVMRAADREILASRLRECGARVLAAGSCAEAAELVRTTPGLHGIFTGDRLPDGTYAQVLDIAQSTGHPIPTAVCLREVDGGWVDLLEDGVLRVVTPPYAREQLEPIVGAMLREQLETRPT